MTNPAGGTGPPFRRVRLGTALRRMREQQRLTQEQVAEKIGVTDDRISRAEKGRTKIDVPMLRALLGTYGVEDQELRAALEEMTSSAAKRGWWLTHQSSLLAAFIDFLGLEEDADGLSVWESALIPGHLQTREYARALLQGGVDIVHSSTERVDDLVQVRMERQRLLAGGSPLRLSVVLGLQALQSGIGGCDVMRRQIQHLLAQSKSPNIELQVLPPEGAHAGLDGAFTIFSFPDGGSLASIETLVTTLYVDDDTSVAAYRRAHDQLMRLALSPAATQELLAELTK